MFIKKKRFKVLIIGSAPSAQIIADYQNEIAKYYDEIYCINNAWALAKNITKVWCRSSDYEFVGTLFPTKEDENFIKEVIVNFKTEPLWYHWNEPNSGTMFLSTLYHIVNSYRKNFNIIDIHVIGSDFDYSNKSQTHFYGLGKVTDWVLEKLKENTPEHSDVAADPLRCGIKALKDELDKTLKIPNIELRTLSDNPNQLLPYKKFSIKDLKK